VLVANVITLVATAAVTVQRQAASPAARSQGYLMTATPRRDQLYMGVFKFILNHVTVKVFCLPTFPIPP
jgi:hypothetical protein